MLSVDYQLLMIYQHCHTVYQLQSLLTVAYNSVSVLSRLPLKRKRAVNNARLIQVLITALKDDH